MFGNLLVLSIVLKNWVTTRQSMSLKTYSSVKAAQIPCLSHQHNQWYTDKDLSPFCYIFNGPFPIVGLNHSMQSWIFMWRLRFQQRLRGWGASSALSGTHLEWMQIWEIEQPLCVTSYNGGQQCLLSIHARGKWYSLLTIVYIFVIHCAYFDQRMSLFYEDIRESEPVLFGIIMKTI